jgi:hypothetical protein
MTRRAIILAACLAVVFAWRSEVPAHGQADALPVPGFHHLHLNSTNPELAIAFYAKEFPTTSKTTWGGQPALKSTNNVLVLFERVEMPPATQPQTAVWHFWHVTIRSARSSGIRST